MNINRIRKKGIDVLAVTWPYVFFICSVAATALVMTHGIFLYGSTTDWIVQHTVIPEHLRQMYYDTGVLFPQFDPNIGAGQNIYFLAYYGYLNPVVMFSYLLPRVPMEDYLTGAALLAVIVSVCLVYHWLRERYSMRVAFFASLMFEFATPLIFHSHKQLMFIMYMPFLVAAFIGACRYLHGRSPFLMIFSMFFVIMTSFYFSVGGLLALVIYIFIEYFRLREESGERFRFGDMFRKLFPAAAGLILSILMAGVLILPELSAIQGNRTENNVSYTLFDLLFPNLVSSEGTSAFYLESSMGLTAAFAVALAVCIISKKHWQRALGIIFALISCERVFTYLLNGRMYADAKALIPFLPLAAYTFAVFADDVWKKQIRFRPLVIVCAVLCVFAFIQSGESNKWYEILFMVDLIVTFIVLAVALYGRGTGNVLLSLTVIAAIVSSVSIVGDNLVSADSSERDILKAERSLSKYVGSYDKGLYRTGNLYYPGDTVDRIMDSGYLSTTSYLSTSSSLYSDFLTGSLYNSQPSRNSMIHDQTEGLFINLFMGNKYLFSSSQPAAGYYPLTEEQGITLWANPYAYPLAYATSAVISKNTYDSLSAPEKTAALMTHAVTEHRTAAGDNDVRLLSAKRVHVNGFYDFETASGTKIPAKRIFSGVYRMNLFEEMTEQVQLEKSVKNRALLVSMNVENLSRTDDVSIWVNGQKNKLTGNQWKYYNGNRRFEYVITSDQKISKLKVTFGQGKYEISDFRVYSVSRNAVEQARKNISEFQQVTDSEGRVRYPSDPAEGVILDGSIDVRNDGYFVTTIPYDSNFTFYLDGKKTDYYLTDEAFMGFPVTQGTHTVKAVYHNTDADRGLAVTGAGFAALALWMMLYYTLPAARKRRSRGGRLKEGE